MPFSQGAVGPQVNPDSPNPVVVRLGKQGDQIASELHGRYYEQCYRGNTFFAASQAVATTSVGLATTYTGLCLSNPNGSGVNVVLLQASMMQSIIQATQPEAFALAVGFNTSTNVTHTTPSTTLQSAKVGSGINPQAKVDTSATLPTAPVYSLFVQNTASATVNGPGAVIDVAGSLILTPGAYVCWVTPTTASVAGMWFSYTWEEVAV